MMMNQLEDTMKCGPKPKDRPRWRTKNNRSLKKCVGEQRNYQSKIEMISVLSFGKRLTFLQLVQGFHFGHPIQAKFLEIPSQRVHWTTFVAVELA